MIHYSNIDCWDSLKEFVHSYGLVEGFSDDSEPKRKISPPSGLAKFLFILDEQANNLRTFKDSDIEFGFQRASLIGQITYPMEGISVGKIKLLMVFFQPLGLYKLFGYNMHLIRNRMVKLSRVMGLENAQILIEMLTKSQSNLGQIEVLNHYFSSIRRPAVQVNITQKTLQLIHEVNGNISIKELESLCEYNIKTIERHFALQVGCSPKEYANIVRFKYVINCFQKNPLLSWCDLAYESGFSDQSHMIKYFRNYLKITPNQLKDLDLQFLRYILR